MIRMTSYDNKLNVTKYPRYLSSSIKPQKRQWFLFQNKRISSNPQTSIQILYLYEIHPPYRVLHAWIVGSQAFEAVTYRNRCDSVKKVTRESSSLSRLTKAASFLCGKILHDRIFLKRGHWPVHCATPLAPPYKIFGQNFRPKTHCCQEAVAPPPVSFLSYFSVSISITRACSPALLHPWSCIFFPSFSTTRRTKFLGLSTVANRCS